jgi:hypothetical protein
MKVFKAFLFVIASLASVTHGALVYKPCPNVDQKVTIHNLTVTPDPIQGGKNMTLNVQATLDCLVDKGAYVEGSAKYLFFKVPIEKQEACDYVKCPLEKGTFNITQEFDIKDNYPPGDYEVHLDGYNADGSVLLCIDGTVSLA